MRKATRGRNAQQRKNRGGGGNFEHMLDMGRLAYFLYDVKQIFQEMGVEEFVYTPILSSIVAKAGRISIDAAEEYIAKKVSDGDLPIDAEKPLIGLLNRYSRMR